VARKQRKPQRPAVDFSAVYDPPLLADGYKSRVAAALPPGAVASDVFWNALTAAVAFYVMQQQRRLRRPHLQARTLGGYRQADRRAGARASHRPSRNQVEPQRSDVAEPRPRCVGGGAKEGRRARRLSPHARDRLQGPSESRSLGVLRRRVRSLDRPLGARRVTFFDRAERTAARTADRFFQAAVAPLLGADAPSAHAVASIIRRERPPADSVLKPRKNFQNTI
jgi:hypothetical protein